MVCQSCGIVDKLTLRVSAMIPSDRALVTFYKLSNVNSNHVPKCSSLEAIFSEKF